MYKVLFVCHGTTPITLDLPCKATLSCEFSKIYYQFTTILSSDMTKEHLRGFE